MNQQKVVGDPTQPRDLWLLWWHEHRIDMNRHREAYLQSIAECRAAIWSAEIVLAKSIYFPLD